MYLKSKHACLLMLPHMDIAIKYWGKDNRNKILFHYYQHYSLLFRVFRGWFCKSLKTVWLDFCDSKMKAYAKWGRQSQNAPQSVTMPSTFWSQDLAGFQNHSSPSTFCYGKCLGWSFTSSWAAYCHPKVSFTPFFAFCNFLGSLTSSRAHQTFL